MFDEDIACCVPIGMEVPIDPTQAPVDLTPVPQEPPTAAAVDPTPAPQEPPTPAPVDPTPVPQEPPTEAPVDPTPTPQEPPTEAPVDSTPAPEEPPTEAPVDPTPAPQEPTPAPVDPTPVPQEPPTEAPVDPTPAPQELTGTPTALPTVPPTTSSPTASPMVSPTGFPTSSPTDPQSPGFEEDVTLLAIVDFTVVQGNGLVAAYKDNNRQALAIDAKLYKDKFAAAETIYDGKDGSYTLVVTALTETDGESTYKLFVNGNEIGLAQQNPASEIDYQPVYHSWNSVALKNGDVIQVHFNSASNGKIPEGSGFAYSRGRWTTLTISAESR